VFIRIYKDIIGEATGHDIPDSYSRLFCDFPPCTGFYRFTKLQMPARKLPRIFTVGTDSLSQQQPVTVPDHDPHTDMRPSVHWTIKIMNSRSLIECLIRRLKQIALGFCLLSSRDAGGISRGNAVTFIAFYLFYWRR
jgi:hypothetical protein